MLKNYTNKIDSEAKKFPFLDILRCPISGSQLDFIGGKLRTFDGRYEYATDEFGIPLFAEEFCDQDAYIQQQHYDRVSSLYLRNLTYPHTQEYMAFLDRVLLELVDYSNLGTVRAICCGHGEAFLMLDKYITKGVGVDVSHQMLRAAASRHGSPDKIFVQGDATRLPLVEGCIDTVFILGGIHHVNDRLRLFEEISRILKPGGLIYFREPVSDFAPWRWIRKLIYRLSPSLDHETERPLLFSETVPPLTKAGLKLEVWRTCGFFGFCIFMNSDILIINRLFRFIPGIRFLVRLSTYLDEMILKLPWMRRNGLQVIAKALKPSRID